MLVSISSKVADEKPLGMEDSARTVDEKPLGHEDSTPNQRTAKLVGERPIGLEDPVRVAGLGEEPQGSEDSTWQFQLDGHPVTVLCDHNHMLQLTKAQAPKVREMEARITRSLLLMCSTANVKWQTVWAGYICERRPICEGQPVNSWCY